VLSLDASKEITHDGALRTLNEDLLTAMKEVGDKFGSGELILPFVLKSAECMKAAVGELEKYLLQKEGSSKGKLVLGTVYGDVHDIGKNLVKTIFQNNGYTVYDLGKQVPLQKFLEKIDEVNPDAIGLSALLVSTSKQMQFFVEHVRKNNMNVPILCGGAAINSNYINRIAKADGIYEPGVFYCNTMFEGLKTMDALVSDEKPKLLAQWKEKLENWKEKSTATIDPANIPKSDIKPVTAPTPKIIGEPIRLKLDQIKMDEVWQMIDKKSLFKLSWGLRGKAGAESEEEHEQLLSEWKIRIIRDKLIEPEIVYGYFRCHNKNGKLLVENTNGNDVEFDFPRSTKPEHLCLTDYFGDGDIVAFQSVTVGNKVAEIIELWNKEDKYADAYYLHGLAVEVAEALAEWINQKMKSELNLEQGGLRYSWGFPSCPDVSQHQLVWKLLQPEKSGMTLTESGQIIPEQSTAAIVVHHPQAKYFVL
jgi:5-methyltetrahydrofolate--homocysteine methyltransferase